MFGFNKKSDFPKSQLIPLIIKLGDFLNMGYDQYRQVEQNGLNVDAEMIALFIKKHMKDWNPVVDGKEVLDEDTKQAAARFLAGVAISLAKRE